MLLQVYHYIPSLQGTWGQCSRSGTRPSPLSWIGIGNDGKFVRWVGCVHGGCTYEELEIFLQVLSPARDSGTRHPQGNWPTSHPSSKTFLNKETYQPYQCWLHTIIPGSCEDAPCMSVHSFLCSSSRTACPQVAQGTMVDVVGPHCKEWTLGLTDLLCQPLPIQVCIARSPSLKMEFNSTSQPSHQKRSRSCDPACLASDRKR